MLLEITIVYENSSITVILKIGNNEILGETLETFFSSILGLEGTCKKTFKPLFCLWQH